MGHPGVEQYGNQAEIGDWHLQGGRPTKRQAAGSPRLQDGRPNQAKGQAADS